MADWIHINNKDTWFNIRQRYEQTFKDAPYSPYTRKAAGFCNIPFNTYRKIGKSSDWIEKERFMKILIRIGAEISTYEDGIQVITEEEKIHETAKKHAKTIREHYGPDWYRNKAIKQWQEQNIECLKSEIRQSDAKITEVSSNLEHIFGWNPGLIEKAFKSYKENDYNHLLFSEEELNLLKHIGEENAYGLIQKHYKDNHDMNRPMYSLQDKGLVRLIKSADRDESNMILKAEKNAENKIEQLKEPYNKLADEISRKISEIEDGYFSCVKEKCSAKDIERSIEDALKTEYKCHSCDSPLEFKDSKEIKIYMAATKQIIEEVVQKIQMPPSIHG